MDAGALPRLRRLLSSPDEKVAADLGFFVILVPGMKLRCVHFYLRLVAEEMMDGGRNLSLFLNLTRKSFDLSNSY